MKLPNFQNARVDQTKITDYLLSGVHPDGASKAAFFSLFGFSLERWDILAEALRRHGQINPVNNRVASAYGIRYTVDGGLETPVGKRPRVRTVWIIEHGSEVPRLITAHPV